MKMKEKAEIEQKISELSIEDREGLADIVLDETKRVKFANDLADKLPAKDQGILVCLNMSYPMTTTLLELLPDCLQESKLRPEIDELKKYYTDHKKDIIRWYNKYEKA